MKAVFALCHIAQGSVALLITAGAALGIYYIGMTMQMMHIEVPGEGEPVPEPNKPFTDQTVIPVGFK